jgi:glycine oxidase
VSVPERADVCVAGGGIIGLAIAHELAGRGRFVVVLDHAGRPGISTPAAAGMLAPVAEADVELPGLCEFRRWSHSLYPEFVAAVEALADTDCGFRTEGTLLVGLDRDHAAEIERLRDIMEAQGFRPRPLTAPEVLQLEPGLVRRVVGGLLLEQDYHIDQRRLALALGRAVEKRGGLVFRDAIVQRAGADGDVEGRRADGTRFRLQCGDVVVAAGSWSNVDLDSPCAHLPLRPVRGQVVRLEAPGLLQRVVRTPDVYMVPHADGALVLGATVEEQGFDARPTAGAVFDLLRHAWRALPGIYDLPLREVSVGFRPVCRDHLPAIGRVQGRVSVATGHFRNGILLAPGTARMLGALLDGGPEPSLLHYFDPRRFDAALSTESGARRGQRAAEEKA